MAQLIVVPCSTAYEAELARARLFAMDRDFLADVGDALVASVDDTGHVSLNQVVNLWAVATGGEDFRTLLTNLLFLYPLLVVLSDETAIAMTRALAASGLDEPFLRHVSVALSPGRAALFALVRNENAAPVLTQLAPPDSAAITALLDEASEPGLRVTFAQAHHEASYQQAGRRSPAFKDFLRNRV